jgi:hypothetical protein
MSHNIACCSGAPSISARSITTIPAVRRSLTQAFFLQISVTRVKETSSQTTRSQSQKPPATIRHYKACCSNATSTPTRGGDTFGIDLAQSRRFGSSGLSPAFEGLLLGVSLRSSAEGHLKRLPPVGASDILWVTEGFVDAIVEPEASEMPSQSPTVKWSRRKHESTSPVKN